MSPTANFVRSLVADSHPAQTGVLITTRRFPLAWLFWTFKTIVAIDGETMILPWGTHFHELAPGRHSVRVGFRYMWAKSLGEDEVQFDVPAGQTTKLTYRSPFLVTSAGSISFE